MAVELAEEHHARLGHRLGDDGGIVRFLGDALMEEIAARLAGIPKKLLWAAAAKPDQAVTLVLCAVPVGWTATIADGRLTPEQEAIPNLKPGEVRELTK
jgi:hypothetical protein